MASLTKSYNIASNHLPMVKTICMNGNEMYNTQTYMHIASISPLFAASLPYERACNFFLCVLRCLVRKRSGQWHLLTAVNNIYFA